MEEREGFIKDSKMALKGVINGILGSSIYEIIISLFISLFVASMVSGNNPNATGEQLESLVDEAYAAFPYSILITCLASIVTLVVFVFIIKKDTFIQLCKKAISLKTIKFGVITALCIMGFSIVYNNLAMNIFNLEDGGNANQETVTTLIKSSAFLGLLAIVILAPIVEEITFRYCMFGEISKRNKILGYLVSGVIFMAMHGVASFSQAGGFNKEFLIELLYLPPYLFSGLALCYAYDKTDNIGSSVIAHILNNLVSFLLVVFL